LVSSLSASCPGTDPKNLGLSVVGLFSLRTRRSQVRVLQGAPTCRRQVGHAPPSLAHSESRRRLASESASPAGRTNLPSASWPRPAVSSSFGISASPRFRRCESCRAHHINNLQRRVSCPEPIVNNSVARHVSPGHLSRWLRVRANGVGHGRLEEWQPTERRARSSGVRLTIQRARLAGSWPRRQRTAKAKKASRRRKTYLQGAARRVPRSAGGSQFF
jgi:hypothetical protein